MRKIGFAILLGITFLFLGRKFAYDFKYDIKENAFIYESFLEILKDQYNNEKEICWLKKDTIGEEYECSLVLFVPILDTPDLVGILLPGEQPFHVACGIGQDA